MHQLKIEIKSNKVELEGAFKLIKEKLELALGSVNYKQFYVASQEAIRNAYEHGNLEISNAQKEIYLTNNKLDEELILREKSFGDRLIKVELLKIDQKLILSVKDEGKGFIPNPHDLDQSNKISGRGLSLIYAGCDHVQFNELGNQITLTKLLSEN